MFENREEAARLLLRKLEKFIGFKNLLILAIPRGGVAIGKIVADTLTLPLDILVIKKIGVPGNPELAIGAVGPSNTVYWDESIIKSLNLDKGDLKILKLQKEKEQAHKEIEFRSSRKALEIKNKIIILVDDGVATGATVLCAQKYLKKSKAKKITLAVPVIAKNTYQEIKRYFDEIISLKKVENFYAVGQFYKEFPQVSDDEVIKILNKQINK
ncbi:MAG: phosphoribosyltransferase [Patescibacteria group bacterium]|nr:phosphoribosyltransferase [Patescibacteria group bacterium]